ncbi:hypothetical protein LY76DRAFT_587124 [Colletotrichum caudatum]|nr:hypothetical protein LY76DRAFT_587124 [Colletotrichum caudatum]
MAGKRRRGLDALPLIPSPGDTNSATTVSEYDVDCAALGIDRREDPAPRGPRGLQHESRNALVAYPSRPRWDGRTLFLSTVDRTKWDELRLVVQEDDINLVKCGCKSSMSSSAFPFLSFLLSWLAPVSIETCLSTEMEGKEGRRKETKTLLPYQIARIGLTLEDLPPYLFVTSFALGQVQSQAPPVKGCQT